MQIANGSNLRQRKVEGVTVSRRASVQVNLMKNGSTGYGVLRWGQIGYAVNIASERIKVPKIKISDLQIRKCLAKGMGVVEIAKEFGMAKSSISERVKGFKSEIDTELVLGKADSLLGYKFDVMGQLLKISEAVNHEINFITLKIEKGHEKFRKGWQRQLLAHCAEVRKQVSLVMEISSQLYKVEEVSQFQKTVLEEIGNAAPEVRERILKRLTERAALAKSYGFGSS